VGTYSTREKHENATVESYRVALLLFAVETASIQIRNGFLTYLTIAILLSPGVTTLYTPPSTHSSDLKRS